MNFTVHWDINDGENGFPKGDSKPKWGVYEANSYREAIKMHAKQNGAEAFTITPHGGTLHLDGVPYRNYGVGYRKDGNHPYVTKTIKVFNDTPRPERHEHISRAEPYYMAQFRDNIGELANILLENACADGPQEAYSDAATLAGGTVMLDHYDEDIKEGVFASIGYPVEAFEHVYKGHWERDVK